MKQPDPWVDPWRGEAVARWLALEEAMDRVLTPFGNTALAAAQARLGERVLDVGCGCGPTTVVLAEAVGETGHVLGVDIAGALLERARERTSRFPQVEFVEADGETASPATDRDLLFSRFGLMFFRDAGAAFRNLARALRHGGRLAYVAWRRFEENPWLHVPFVAAREVLRDAHSPPADGPGPFRLADPDDVQSLLARAGFTEIELNQFDHAVALGTTLPAAVEFSMSTGPTGRALPGAEDETRARVRAHITAALAPHASAAGIVLAGSAWVVTARLDR